MHWIWCFYLFLTSTCHCDIFESQPRMLLELGNIVLESSVDRNITFKARGRGSINMMTEMGYYSLSHQMLGTNSDLLSRLDSLESSVSNSRILANRLDALETRVQDVVV